LVRKQGERAESGMKVFVPMDERGQPLPADASARTPGPIEKRRYTRHRFSTQVEVHREQGYDVDAMTFEISEGGMSAATPNILTIGEKVEIRTLAALRIKAIVRRKHGAIYGFEFLEMTHAMRERIRNVCKGLPLFLSMLDDV